jgi:hypothetical protein
LVSGSSGILAMVLLSAISTEQPPKEFVKFP